MAEELRIIALGGYGEVGKNLTVVEYGEDLLVIDVGVAFPNVDMLGVELLLPDFAYLRENAARVRGIILTHGHEDHIGGVPFLLREVRIPVYGTRLTLGLLRGKMEELTSAPLPPLHEVAPGDRLSLGPFTVDLIRVNHSIPDGVALGVHTPAGLIVHSGDFKFDYTPIDGQLTDFAHFAHLGQEGVLALIADTTNVGRTGFTPSERMVGETFAHLFPQAPRRIIVALFASHLHRIQQVCEVAARQGRKVVPIGRSMERCVRIALELGYLRVEPDILVPQEALARYRDEDLVLLTTGGQGEPLSALVRMARGEHRQLEIHEGDTVIISATPIPGNETMVWRTINDLFRRGAEVIYYPHAQVHVSGHASREEIKLLFNLLRPQYTVPFHGEYRHLVAYADLAEEMGLPRDNVFLLENGDVLTLSATKAAVTERVSADTFTVEGTKVQRIVPAVLRERQELAESGVVLVAVTVDSRMGTLVAGPEITARGWLGEEAELGELLAAARLRVKQALARFSPRELQDPTLIANRLRNVLTRYFHRHTHFHPLVVPLTLETERQL